MENLFETVGSIARKDVERIQHEPLTITRKSLNSIIELAWLKGAQHTIRDAQGKPVQSMDDAIRDAQLEITNLRFS